MDYREVLQTAEKHTVHPHNLQQIFNFSHIIHEK